MGDQAQVQREETTAGAATAQGSTGLADAGAHGASAMGQSSELASTRHYRVELKAWIPHREVIDPEEVIRVTNRAGELADNVVPAASFDYTSRYRGDNHADYGGGHRVLVVLEFDYDGTTISGIRQSGSYGTTHRDWHWELKLPVVGQVASDRGTEAKTATKAMSQAAAGRTFTLSMASSNPVVITMAPDIDSKLTGTFDASGALTLSYKTDLFPSHGIRVQCNGSDLISPAIVNDASGVDGLGVTAAAEIGARLSAQMNTGSITVPGAWAPGT